MALIIGPENTSFAQRLGSSLGSGLGQGLSMLAQNKLDEMRRSKFSELLKNAGYEPGQADVLAYLQQQQPQQFHQVLGQQQQANTLKREQYKDKLRPEIDYLDNLEGSLNALEELINQQEDPVSFGLLPSRLSQVSPSLVGENTGTYDALSNKFHTDAAQNTKGVRSVYHVKILGASKPGLDKSREQNMKILKHWRSVINNKKSKFLKAHPMFNDELTSYDTSKKFGASAPSKPKLGDVKEEDGKILAWDPNLKDWVEASIEG
jgi:hypothetical protein